MQRSLSSCRLGDVRVSFLATLLVATVLSAGGAASIGAPGGKVARGRSISYLAKLDFGLEYKVEWTEEGGDRYGDCTAWSLDRGTNAIVAGNTKPLPVRLTIYPEGGWRRSAASGGWADGVAVGPARASVERTFVHAGGTTACGESPATTDVPPRTDCGPRRYSTRAAVVRAELRVLSTHLSTMTTTVALGTTGRRQPGAVFALSVVARPPYRKCRTTEAAPELPVNLGLFLHDRDSEALRSLKPGERHEVDRQIRGLCRGDLPEDVACSYILDAYVNVQRWKPGTPYP